MPMGLGMGLNVFVPAVQKVSNLILNVNIFVRDTVNARALRAMTTDLRGNTGETWLRGIRHLVKEQLLMPEKTQ